MASVLIFSPEIETWLPKPFRYFAGSRTDEQRLRLVVDQRMRIIVPAWRNTANFVLGQPNKNRS